jgi:hypothetical protein
VRAGISTLNPDALPYYRSRKISTIKVIPKKRGRPPTGKDPVTAVRLPDDLRTAIDDWRRRQKDLPTRSEAIRRLVLDALKQAR